MSKKPLILHVDDDALVLQMAEYSLRGTCQVVTCQDPEKALALIQREPFEVVIVDLKMPRIGGFEILEHAKKVRPLASRILASAFVTDAEAKRAIEEVGVTMVLAKPWDLEELQAAVAYAVSEARRRHRLKGR